MEILTQNLERTAARNLVDYVGAYRSTAPEIGATAIPFAGGTAAFTGVDSPLTAIKGAGPTFSADELDEAESFFRARGAAAVVIEAAPWLTPAALELLDQRGYEVAGGEDVVVGEAGNRERGTGNGTADVLLVEEVPPGEWPELMRTAFELPEEAPWPDLLRASAHLPRARLLGIRDDRGKWMACAQVAECGATAIFGCDGTLPAARGRGAQLALIRERLRLIPRGSLVTAEVAPGGGSQRNYFRAGFRVVYHRKHYRQEG